MPIFRRKQPADKLERRLRSRRRWLIRLVGLALVMLAGRLIGPRILPQIALAQIGYMVDCDVEAEFVDLDLSGSVSIKGLRVSPYIKTPYDNTILTAESVKARFNFWSLLTFSPQLKTIAVEDFVLNGLYDVTADRWNIGEVELNITGEGSGKLPSVSLQNGMFRYVKVGNADSAVSFEVPIDASFAADPNTPNRYAFEIATADKQSGAEKTTISGSWAPGHLIMSGAFRSTHMPTYERTYDIESLSAELKYFDDSSFSLALRISNLFGTRVADSEAEHFVVPEFIKRSGPIAGLQSFFGQFRPWGSIDIGLDASGNLKTVADSRFTGTINCRDVHLWDRKFPYRLDHLQGQINFTQQTTELKNLRAKHGDVDIEISGGTRKLPDGWQYEVAIGSPNMALDSDLYNALGPGQKKFWAVFWPKGRIVYETRIAGGPGQEKRSDMRVELQNIEANCQFFPYPLENITGTLLFAPGEITFSDLFSEFDDRQVTVAGTIEFPEPNRPVYSISVDVNDIPLDDVLAAALPEQQQHSYHQFSPSGFGRGNVHVFNSKTDPKAFAFEAGLSFRDAVLDSNEPAMKITGITAEAVFTPDAIEIKRLDGSHAGGAISVSGEIRSGSDAQMSGYDLSVRGEGAQLSEELFSLLPEQSRKTAEELHATGRIDYDAKLVKSSASQSPSYSVSVKCLDNSMQYERLSYPLKDITGTVRIGNEHIVLEEVSAKPGDNVWITSDESRLQISGLIVLAGGAFGGANMQVQAHDIFFDDQLGDNLPEGLTPFYRRVKPAGRFDADFRSICVWAHQDGSQSFDFDGDIDLKNCIFSVSGAQVQLDGSISTTGTYKGGTGFTACDVKLNAETLRMQGQSLRNVRANIEYDPNGADWSTGRLVAECCGGHITGKGRFRELADARLGYTLQAAFEDIDLKQFLGGTAFKDSPGAEQSAGRMTGSLNVSAGLEDSSTRIGTCRLTVSDMKLGKLPPLTNLLYVLELAWPQDFVFNSLYLDSYIIEDSMLVKRLDLAGPALAFYGSGLVDLPKRNVDLILTARGKRLAGVDPSVLESLTEYLGQMVVRMEVTGSLYDPKVETKSLPVFQDSFGMLRRYHIIPIP